MRFRLPVQLPVEARIDGGAYVVELVELSSTGEHWLRARHAEEPVVFLLARFEDAHAAEAHLERGFEPVAGAFPQALLLQLVEEGVCDICVPRRTERAVQHPTPSPTTDDDLVFAVTVS